MRLTIRRRTLVSFQVVYFLLSLSRWGRLPSKAVVTPIKARTLDAENPLLGIDFIITSSVGRERRGHISLVRLSYVPNFDYPRPGILHSSHMPVRWRKQEPKLWDRRKSSAQRLITVSAWAGSGYDWSLLRHIAYWFPLLAFLSTSCLSPLCTPSFPPKRKVVDSRSCPICSVFKRTWLL